MVFLWYLLTPTRYKIDVYSIVFLGSRHVEWYIMWPWKVNFEVWPRVKVMTWLKKAILHIGRSVSTWQTQWTCFEVCILFQSNVIAQKLQLTSDDVTWPWMPVRWVTGAKFHLHRQCSAYWSCTWAYLLKNTSLKDIWNLSHWLIMARSQKWPDLRSPI